jgi:protein transport protein DSL1/ZW10
MLERDEGTHLAATNNVVNQDWDAAWDSDEDEKPSANGDNDSSTHNRHSLEEERRASEVILSPTALDDDAAEAWGWGDDDEDDNKPPPQEENNPATVSLRSRHDSSQQGNADVRQITMSEKYWTSSMPQPVMRTLTQIFEDGAKLTRPEYAYYV